MRRLGQGLQARGLGVERRALDANGVLQGSDALHRRALRPAERLQPLGELLLFGKQREPAVGGVVELNLLHPRLQRLVLLRLARLAAQAVQPLAQLGDEVRHPEEVGLGGLHLPFRRPPPGLVLRHPGRLFNEEASVFRLGGDNESHPALLNNGVGAGADAGAEKELDNVQEAAGRLVDEVLGLPRAKEAAGDGNFWVTGVLRREAVALGDGERQRHFGHGERALRLAAVEDDVLHASAAQRLGTLLAHHPAERIHHVGLAAAVGPDDAGNSVAEGEEASVHEGLEAGDVQALDAHWRASLLGEENS